MGSFQTYKSRKAQSVGGANTNGSALSNVFFQKACSNLVENALIW
jgi:hypothetical protein